MPPDDDSKIRPARPSDLEALLAMRCRLWPDGSTAEHRVDLERYFSGEAREPLEILVAVDGRGRLNGFCELSIRAYAEGCSSDRVGYLEGWYVEAEHRRRGVGGALVAAAEAWAREEGCPELASDCAIDNRVSAAAHRAIGFEDAGVIRCFRKTL